MSHIILARNAYSLNYDCLNTLPYLREQLYQRFGLLAQLKTTLKKKKKKTHRVQTFSKGEKHTSQVLKSDNFKKGLWSNISMSFMKIQKT